MQSLCCLVSPVLDVTHCIILSVLPDQPCQQRNTPCCCRVSTTSSEDPSAAGNGKRLQPHPEFPRLPSRAPLTYVLMVAACLDQVIHERPTFAQARQVLQDVDDEVATGVYLDANCGFQVRPLLLALQWHRNAKSTEEHIGAVPCVALVNTVLHRAVRSQDGVLLIRQGCVLHWR